MVSLSSAKWGLFAVAFLLAGSTVARGQREEQDAAPPQLFRFDSYDAAALTLNLLQSREVFVPSLFRELDKNGKEVEKVTYLTATEESVQAFAAKDLRTFSLKGEPLKTADVLGKLKKGQPVLAVGSGKLVPKAFRSLFRDDVVVIELPPALPPMAPAAPAPK